MKEKEKEEDQEKETEKQQEREKEKHKENEDGKRSTPKPRRGHPFAIRGPAFRQTQQNAAREHRT